MVVLPFFQARILRGERKVEVIRKRGALNEFFTFDVDGSFY